MTKNRRKKWRVYQFLVACGVVKSKSEAAALAHGGRLTVNGVVMESLHYQIHPFKDVVRIDGVLVHLEENRRYFVLNKPVGVETTKLNMLPYIRDLVPAKDLLSFSPVGRLDKDTSGLLVVTNDGRVGKRVLDPRTKREKVYEATVAGRFTEEAASRLRAGVDIDVDGQAYRTLPARVSFLCVKDRSIVTIGIIEGKKRQVRKMCAVLGFPVMSLRRVAIARLRLDDLPVGSVIEFSRDDLYRLLFE